MIGARPGGGRAIASRISAQHTNKQEMEYLRGFAVHEDKHVLAQKIIELKQLGVNPVKILDQALKAAKK
jgi:hypothetical protein